MISHEGIKDAEDLTDQEIEAVLYYAKKAWGCDDIVHYCRLECRGGRSRLASENERCDRFDN